MRPSVVMKIVLALATIACLSGGAAAQGVGFGSRAGVEPRYPANPQYQYPYPYKEDTRVQTRTKCRNGEVRHQGRCKPARPLALPF